MSQIHRKLAVLFADICGSTTLYEELGDKLARTLISEVIVLMKQEIDAHQGTLIKTIGDEVMCTFPSTEAAFDAACAMQRAVKNDGRGKDHPMDIRIGFHYGEVIMESGDVFGDTVNIAARVAFITRAGQILTTRAVCDALPSELRGKNRHITSIELKGKHKPVDIFLVAWEEDDEMSTRVMTHSSRKQPTSEHELILHYRGHSLSITKERRKAIIGRDASCDVVVPNDLTSRHHVSIELRSGRFVISDQSANGTHIRFADGHEVLIAREEAILLGKGTISLGQPHAENPSELIQFALKSRGS